MVGEVEVQVYMAFTQYNYPALSGLFLVIFVKVLDAAVCLS